MNDKFQGDQNFLTRIRAGRVAGYYTEGNNCGSQSREEDGTWKRQAGNRAGNGFLSLSSSGAI